MRAALRLRAIAVFVLAGSQRTAAQSAFPGWSFTTNITTDSGAGSQRTSMAMRQQATDRFLRMEFVQVSGSAAMSSIEGAYQLFDAVDSTMTMVTPRSRTAMVMGLSMMQMVPGSKTPTMSIHRTRSDIDDLGAGERIAGHATHHVRVTTDGTMDITILGNTCTQSLASVADMWIASDVDFGTVASAFSTKLEGLIGSGPATIEQTGVAQAALPKGAALRTVSRAMRPNAQGVPIAITTTMEIVDISRQPIDAGAFAIPSDYQKMDMRTLMANLPPGMLESAMKTAGTAASEGAKKRCGAGAGN